MLKIINENKIVSSNDVVDINVERNQIVYEIKMSKTEHDSMVMCVETKHDGHIALSGSFDST